MYMRIYWGRTYPGAWPSIEETYRELAKVSTPGLRARFVTQDVNDVESMYTITVWDSLESVQAWEASPAYRDVFLAAIKPFLVGSHSVSLCEVKVEHLAGPIGRAEPA